MPPTSLMSNTLASLYAKQGHQDTAIEVLREVDAKKRLRKSEILTELLQRVTIHATERRSHDIQRAPRSSL
jgi:hypothetical protein